MYFAPSKTVWLSVTFSEESSFTVNCINQTKYVNESSTVIAYTFPVKYKSLGAFLVSSLSALSVTSFSSLNHSLIVKSSYMNFVQPDYNFGKASSYHNFTNKCPMYRSLAAMTDAVFGSNTIITPWPFHCESKR